VTSNTTSEPTCCPSVDAPCVDPRVARSRRAVLTAATELLVESGPRAVTVDAVAERSGVAKSTMYRHWDSRTALLVDVLSANVPHVAPPSPGLPFAEALRALVREVAATLGTAEWAALMPALMSLKQHMPELRQLSEADQEEKTRALADVLDVGVAEGVLPPGLDPSTVASVLIGPVVFGVLIGRLDEIGSIADFAVDRFLASYHV
jgi:AcrR family transcriptional regulator